MSTGEQPNPIDVRQHPRHSFVANVELAVREDGGTEELHFQGCSQNISMGGMFITTCASIPLYALVTADVYPEGVPPLRLYGRVVHVRDGGFGCIFTRVSQQAEARLHLWLGRSGGLPAVAGTIGHN